MSWVSSGWAHNCLGLYHIVAPLGGGPLPATSPPPWSGLSLFLFVFLCTFWLHLAMRRAYSCLALHSAITSGDAQGAYGILGIVPTSAVCKANTLCATAPDPRWHFYLLRHFLDPMVSI